jgi:hypothetical protein
MYRYAEIIKKKKYRNNQICYKNADKIWKYGYNNKIYRQEHFFRKKKSSKKLLFYHVYKVKRLTVFFKFKILQKRNHIITFKLFIQQLHCLQPQMPEPFTFWLINVNSHHQSGLHRNPSRTTPILSASSILCCKTPWKENLIHKFWAHNHRCWCGSMCTSIVSLWRMIVNS